MEFLSSTQLERYLSLSPAGKKSFLRDLLSASQPDEESHVGLAKVLFSLEDEDAKYSAMEPRSRHDPKLFDVLITDISETNLLNIGRELGTGRLSAAPEFQPNAYPIKGIIYGPTSRVFVPMIVGKRDININVPFLFDTGSPNTYLREDTMRALGFVDNIPTDTMVRINDITITAFLSRGHFENVDLIGQDCMVSLRAKVLLDYGDKTVEVQQGVRR
jgi:hypothetical protein